MAIDIGVYLTTNWWKLLIGLISIASIIWIIWVIIKKKMKHKHKFINSSSVFILHKGEREFPRIISICKKCGIAVHSPVYNKNQIEELDKKEDDDE